MTRTSLHATYPPALDYVCDVKQIVCHTDEIPLYFLPTSREPILGQQSPNRYGLTAQSIYFQGKGVEIET